MTILLKGFQFIHLPYILNHTIIKAFAKKGKDADKISGFQALTTALSTTLGTGNIVGVALAVAYGGPGAVFWMWIIGLVAAIIKYSEVVTALRYRFKNEKVSGRADLWFISLKLQALNGSERCFPLSLF